MTSIQTLPKIFALCALNASLLPGARSQVFVPEDPLCRATPEMVHDGFMAVTDPNCLVVDGPGCNFFSLLDCRVCALILEGITDEVLPCELLDIFNQESEGFGEESVDEDDFKFPPPVVPTDPIDAIDAVEPTDSGNYVPVVIVLPTDIFIESESSTWDVSESSADYPEDSNAGDDATVDNRRLRTQL